MKGSTHLIIGLSAGMVASSLLSFEPHEVPWVALLAGSLAPDFDEDESTIAKPGKFLKRVLPKLVCDIADAFAKALSITVKAVFGHRGFLHWPVVGVVIMALGMRYQIVWLSWFGFGYLSHLAADACTVQGIPLFAPLNRDFISWSPIRTGGITEKIISLVCAIVIISWGWRYMDNHQFLNHP